MKNIENMLTTAQIFADANQNNRFYLAIEVLAQVMMVMPRALDMATLAHATGKPTRALRKVLDILQEDGLVSRDAKQKDAWHCRDCHGMITLADVYHCFLAYEQRSSEPENQAERSSSQQSVDLLMMQVKMTVNRAMLQQLAQFDLSRLRGLASTKAMRPQLARARGFLAEPS